MGVLWCQQCVTVFEKVRHRLGKWRNSEKQLRMGNRTIIPSLAVWEGRIQLGEVIVRGEFEVFNSGGSWDFLLGKPLLKAFHAKQEYSHQGWQQQGGKAIQRDQTTMSRRRQTRCKPHLRCETVQYCNRGLFRTESPFEGSPTWCLQSHRNLTQLFLQSMS